jgi:hypothetical protein
MSLGTGLEAPKCQNTSCPRSDTFLCKEDENNWAFACRTCHGLQVISKPHILGKERVEAMIRGIKRTAPKKRTKVIVETPRGRRSFMSPDGGWR